MWIILRAQEKEELESDAVESFELTDLAVTNNYGCLLVFETLQDAAIHQDNNYIDGQCIELPLR